MKIISKTPAENGAYPALQEWPGLVAPESHYKWPDTLETETFYQYNGFVALTVVRSMVQSYQPNVEAWEAWKATLPPEPEPGASDTDVLNTLLGVTE
jgi:hypothetical protein